MCHYGDHVTVEVRPGVGHLILNDPMLRQIVTVVVAGHREYLDFADAGAEVCEAA